MLDWLQFPINITLKIIRTIVSGISEVIFEHILARKDNDSNACSQFYII